MIQRWRSKTQDPTQNQQHNIFNNKTRYTNKIQRSRSKTQYPKKQLIRQTKPDPKMKSKDRDNKTQEPNKPIQQKIRNKTTSKTTDPKTEIQNSRSNKKAQNKTYFKKQYHKISSKDRYPRLKIQRKGPPNQKARTNKIQKQDSKLEVQTS